MDTWQRLRGGDVRKNDVRRTPNVQKSDASSTDRCRADRGCSPLTPPTAYWIESWKSNKRHVSGEELREFCTALVARPSIPDDRSTDPLVGVWSRTPTSLRRCKNSEA